MPESNRFATLLLAAGAAVLLVAILLGEQMGNRVFSKIARGQQAAVTAIAITPEPPATSGPYGPDWRRSETLTAVAQPNFPDPRVPPKPLPTPRPAPTPTKGPLGSPTPNPNVPIWRQQPLPTVAPAELAPAAPAGPSAPAAPASPTAATLEAQVKPTP